MLTVTPTSKATKEVRPGICARTQLNTVYTTLSYACLRVVAVSSIRGTNGKFSRRRGIKGYLQREKSISQVSHLETTQTS